MACDKRRANEDQARQTEYEEVSLLSSYFSFYACLTYHVDFIHNSSSFGSLDRKSEFVAFFLGLSYLAHQLHIFRAFSVN